MSIRRSRSDHDGAHVTWAQIPRRPRAFDDGLFHLAVRASDTRHLFVTDTDRVTFVKLLGEIFADYELVPASYTLMGTHYHLILYTPDARLSRAMQKLHTTYSRVHNRKQGRAAHLFRAHFAACEIDDERQLLATYRYLALNPVKAGLTLRPFTWRWCSSAAHAGLRTAEIALDESQLRATFDNRADWRRSYQRLIEAV